MERDEERETEEENGEWNQEVGVGKDGSDVLGECHRDPVRFFARSTRANIAAWPVGCQEYTETIAAPCRLCRVSAVEML
jgi:hypothetical protein